MLLEEVNDYLDLDLDDTEVDTLAGWIYMQIDHPPRVGDTVRHTGYEFVVGEVDHYRITRVLVKKVAKEAPKEQEGQEEPVPNG